MYACVYTSTHMYVCCIYVCISICVYTCVCICVYMYVYVCIPVLMFLFPPQERLSFCPTAKRRHQEVMNCVYLQTSRSTYVKPVFTYFDLQNHSSFPMVPHLTRQRPLCGILTGRRVGGTAQARLSGGRQALHCRSGLIFSTFSRHTKGQRKQL